MLDTEKSSIARHEEGKVCQNKHQKDVMSFVKATGELGNPFDDGNEIVALHTKTVMESYASLPVCRCQIDGQQKQVINVLTIDNYQKTRTKGQAQ